MCVFLILFVDKNKKKLIVSCLQLYLLNVDLAVS